ncbi:hypothetical protein ILYODFUR_016814 [Ilyodon furcidens]|uniref:Uncharacterized protein n=1 Tax=Ilyodon furcidens TaxID=33524 RepID=A0ABV0U9V8_9TELE
MSKDSNHSLLHWTSPVSSLLNSSLLGLPLKNLVHPPPSTIHFHYPPSSTSRVNNYLVSLLLHPLADHSIIPVKLNYYSLVFDPEYSLLTILFILQLVSRFQFPCPRHYTVNKLFTKKLCLLNCFLHVGQTR